MCGRYATSQTAASLQQAFEIDLVNSFVECGADYNVAPTKLAPLIIGRDRGGDGRQRELVNARWGLIPSWAKDPSIGNRLINARSETVAQKPSFAKAFATRRALVPADGYFEWYTPPTESGRSKPPRQPFYLTPADGSVLAMAGIYEFFRHRDAEQWSISFSIITRAASQELRHIHERMPLLIAPDDYDDWLAPQVQQPDVLLARLAGDDRISLSAYPVSTAVNNVRNNGPELIAALPAE